MKEPFLSAVPLIKRLENAGFEAYFVGGSVRDYLLGRPIHDVDIATSATPEEVKQLFQRTVDIGIEHGTVLVLYQQKPYEITTFRAEGEYRDYRRPAEVSFIRKLNDDLERRDFTMNAIAMDRNGMLIDPFNGRQDIENRIIRTVGPAKDRFNEDALRLMRAVRFVSQLSFQIEDQTLKALSSHVFLLQNIAIERKKAEFEKILLGKSRKQAIEMMLDTNLISFLPGLTHQEKAIKQLLSFHCEHLNKNEIWALLIFCLNLSTNQAEAFLREWRLSVKEIKDIQRILFFFRKRLEQVWTVYDLYSAGPEVIQSAETLYLVINGMESTKSVQSWLNVYQELPIKDRTELAVSGSDLLKWFEKPGGPWVKEMLLKIEQAILEGIVVNDQQQIKEWLIACSQN